MMDDLKAANYRIEILEQENERLRGIGVEYYTQVLDLEAENERLRNDESHLRLQLADAEQDVERLRERGDWAVEQLRSAEAAVEELRNQLSLNRIHDRDCVAREAEVTRLREDNERLRQEIADLLGDGFPALADQPTEEK